jgi:prepilin-type N-terminal cleavage/methylation domain-containing protein
MLMRKENPRETRQRRGFTLIEVLVVVMIIVILAGGGTMLYLRFLEQAKADTSYTRLKNLEKACEAYAIKNGGYPVQLQDLVQAGLVEESALLDAWDQPIAYDANGGMHNGTKPDLWVEGHNDPQNQGRIWNH